MTKVEFNNIYKDKVLDNIQKLIKQTIPGVPLYYDEHRGQESFLITPVSDAFVDFASNAHTNEKGSGYCKWICVNFLLLNTISFKYPRENAIFLN